MKQSIETLLTQFQNSGTSPNENFLALYFHRLWQAQPASKARKHLKYYLEEPCYWKALQITKIIQQQAASANTDPLSLYECFQIGIDQFEKILKEFSSPRNSSLKSLANLRFWTLIRDELDKLGEILICTDWALLRKLNETSLKRHLKECGYTQKHIERYVLVWKWFYEIYVPTTIGNTRQLIEPDNTTWENIARLYAERSRSQCGPQTIKNWALDIVNCVRSKYRIPCPMQRISGASNDQPNDIDIPIPPQDEPDEEFLKTLKEMQACLRESLARLKLDTIEMFRLYYGQNRSYTKVAQEVRKDYSTVHRGINRAEDRLLRELAKWCEENEQITLDSYRLAELKPFLKEWLINHFCKNLPTT